MVDEFGGLMWKVFVCVDGSKGDLQVQDGEVVCL
jgi:hypothetical protein